MPSIVAPVSRGVVCTACGSLEFELAGSATVADLQDRLVEQTAIPLEKMRVVINMKTHPDSIKLCSLMEDSRAGNLWVEVFDLRYLESFLSERGVDAIKLFDDENTDCIPLRHHESCKGGGCSSSRCFKAGPAIYIMSRTDES